MERNLRKLSTSRAYGLAVRFEEDPPGCWEKRPPAASEVEIRPASAAAIDDCWSGFEALGWEATSDGVPFRVERGRAGDHRFLHGPGSLHHLSADGALLLRAVEEGGPLGWRVTLDSVLFSVALLAGNEALHAGAVVGGDGAVAIAAGTGGGKSTLLATLLELGLPLLCDDILALEARPDAAPVAHPGPPLMNLPAVLRDPARAVPIALIGDERWVAVPTAAAPVPLAALVLLDRRPGLSTAIQPVAQPLVPLMHFLQTFPRTPEREGARFEIAAEIAAQASIWRLTAAPEVPARELAAVLETEVNLGARALGPAVPPDVAPDREPRNLASTQVGLP